MYLGLMTRGASIMLLFVAIITVANLAYTFWPLNFLLAIIWFYSFFDTHHSLRKLLHGETVSDDSIINVSYLNFSQRYVGYGLLGLGSIIVLQVISSAIVPVIGISPARVWEFKQLFFGGLFIASGLYILKKNASTPKYPIIEDLGEEEI